MKKLSLFITLIVFVSSSVFADFAQKPVDKLIIAAEDGNLKKVKYYIEQQGISPNAKASYGDYPLHSAARRGNLSIVKYLIKKGAKVNLKDGHNRTPLHHAAMSKLSVFKYLLKKKAKLKAKNSLDMNVLHIAAKKGKLRIVKYLIEKKDMDEDIETKDGKTPLDLAKAESKHDWNKNKTGYKKVIKYLEDL